MCYAYDFTNEMDALYSDLHLELINEDDGEDLSYYDILNDLCVSMEDEFINALMEGYK